ncbi:4'-phosphopantetheinyl transferase superfamily protein [Lewinella sp. JB7]|uniref:4'-phosphopantetheinyl transferase family protein n=1 Tax=Lewinella sp. JB7 TaxID=2962887 RepID=UPI0020C985C2|nr:4'-phosphopantetheinyl transferase superfamily protein [Lewinella sp. JB7]MCP9236226.1 4'-phosphopantetheinyl transferase superfamily protein [Lewinella sp. JB7]
MPLLFHDSVLPPGEWGLWRIDESESDLRGHVSLFHREIEQIERIRGAERRREFLAARLLLHHMSGRSVRAELIKDTDGKPHLDDSLFFVSISHTVGYSAAIAHPRPCGVDVQRIVPRIRRLARKFVNVEESVHLQQEYELTQLHLIWAAKEAMYKAYGKRQLDFREHLHVNLADYGPEISTADAYLRTETVTMHFHLEFRCYPTFVIVAAVEINP